MHAKTEELLNTLLWTAETLFWPRMRHVIEGYDGWASRHGLLQQAARLEKRGLLESPTQAAEGERIYRLSAAGRLHALGGRDPQVQWSRAWDGQWRMILFDVPTRENSHRERIRRHLRSRRFGCLQRSVWITPDPMEDEHKILMGSAVNVESLVLMEARPIAGETDREIAAGAWDFLRINRQYDQHLQVLEAFPDIVPTGEDSYRKLRLWARDELAAWKNAVELDPLLPDQLLPDDYRGKVAWTRREQVLAQAGQRVRESDPEKRST